MPSFEQEDFKVSLFQLRKLDKHSRSSTAAQDLSVYSSEYVACYDALTRLTIDMGWRVQYDDGRINFIVPTTHDFGTFYLLGELVPKRADANRVVLTSDPGRIHGFHDSSTSLDGVQCCRCGAVPVHIPLSTT